MSLFRYYPGLKTQFVSFWSLFCACERVCCAKGFALAHIELKASYCCGVFILLTPIIAAVAYVVGGFRGFGFGTV